MLAISSAFDTLDHQMLLSRLHMLGDLSLSWFTSYLSDRSSSVNNNSFSSPSPMKYIFPRVLGSGISTRSFTFLYLFISTTIHNIYIIITLCLSHSIYCAFFNILFELHLIYVCFSSTKIFLSIS